MPTFDTPRIIKPMPRERKPKPPKAEKEPPEPCEVAVPSQIELVSIEDLQPYEKNARTHSEEQIAQIVESMKRFGWTQPILADEKNLIVAGHGRLEAAKLLGLKSVPVIRKADWTEEEKRAYTIADNQLALNAGWDLQMLTDEILDLRECEFDLSLLGFSDVQLADFLGDETAGADETEKVPQSWSVLVECQGEAHQVKLLNEFAERGLKCRALT